jgi:hypothetical protein
MVFHRPCLQNATGELRSIVRRYPLGGDAGHCQPFGHLVAAHETIRFQADAFPRELIDHRKDPESAPVGEPIAHEVHGPALIRPNGEGRRESLPAGNSLPLLGPYLQALLGVQAVNPFGLRSATSRFSRAFSSRNGGAGCSSARALRAGRSAARQKNAKPASTSLTQRFIRPSSFHNACLQLPAQGNRGTIRLTLFPCRHAIRLKIAFAGNGVLAR